MRRTVAATFITLSTIVACAPQPLAGRASAPVSAGARQCFSSQNVSGFNLVGERAVDLRVGANRVYRAELFGFCPGLRSALGVGVRARGGSTFVCDDQDLELIVPSDIPGRGPNVCQVRALRRLAPAEIDAERQAR